MGGAYDRGRRREDRTERGPAHPRQDTTPRRGCRSSHTRTGHRTFDSCVVDVVSAGAARRATHVAILLYVSKTTLIEFRIQDYTCRTYGSHAHGRGEAASQLDSSLEISRLDLLKAVTVQICRRARRCTSSLASFSIARSRRRSSWPRHALINMSTRSLTHARPRRREPIAISTPPTAISTGSAMVAAWRTRAAMCRRLIDAATTSTQSRWLA